MTAEASSANFPLNFWILFLPDTIKIKSSCCWHQEIINSRIETSLKLSLSFTCKHAKAFLSWSYKTSAIWQQGWRYTSSMFYLPSIWLSPLSVEMAALSVSNRAFSKSFIFSSFKLDFTPWIFAFLSPEPFDRDVTCSPNFASRQLNRVFVVAAPAYYTN